MPYRPSCVVHLKLRFDEVLTLEVVPPPQTLLGMTQAPATAPPTTTEPLILRSSSGDQFSWVSARVPTALSYELPGYRQAGTFELEMPFREMPIDPRTLRAVAVEIHTGTVSDEDFAAGIRGQRRADGTLRSIIQTRLPNGQPNESTLRMVGIVDELDMEQSDKGGVFSMRGRDLRGAMLETPIGPDGVKDEQLLDEVDWSKPIFQVVAQILAFNPLFADIHVMVNPDDWPNGVPAPGFSKGGILRWRKGARGQKEAADTKPQGRSSGMNFWDVIVNACNICGAIPYFRNATLCIRPARTVYDKLRGDIDPRLNPTPFLGGRERDRDVVTGAALNPPLRARRLVYGRDVESVKLTRKFMGWHKPRVVRVVGVNMDATEAEGRLVQGIWPPDKADDLKPVKGAKTTTRAPGATQESSEDVITITKEGIKDEAVLTEIAHSVYEEIGRGEIAGEVQTNDLASFGGDNTDPDLLRLQPGDGVEFYVDTRLNRNGAAPTVSTYTEANRKSFEEQVQEILTTIPDRNLARVIVATQRGQVAELQNFFRVQTVKCQWDQEDGIKIHFDFQNYIVARNQVRDAPAAQGEAIEVTATPGATAPSGTSVGSLGGG